MTELLLCLAGWCAMALGMDRHHEDALRRSATAPTLQRLRGAGWVLLAAALAHAVGWPAPTVPMGLVWWSVALSLAALAAARASARNSRPPSGWPTRPRSHS